MFNIKIKIILFNRTCCTLKQTLITKDNYAYFQEDIQIPLTKAKLFFHQRFKVNHFIFFKNTEVKL